jgi:hypothetical protein
VSAVSVGHEDFSPSLQRSPGSGLENRAPALVSKGRCRATWKSRETRQSSRRSVTTYALSSSIAASVPIKPCHRGYGANIERLAKHVAGCAAPTASIATVVPQRCRSFFAGHQLLRPPTEATPGLTGGLPLPGASTTTGAPTCTQL